MTAPTACPTGPGSTGTTTRCDRSVVYEDTPAEEGQALFIGADLAQDGDGAPRILLTNSVHEDPDDEWYPSLDEAETLAWTILQQIATARMVPAAVR